MPCSTAGWLRVPLVVQFWFPYGSRWWDKLFPPGSATCIFSFNRVCYEDFQWGLKIFGVRFYCFYKEQHKRIDIDYAISQITVSMSFIWTHLICSMYLCVSYKLYKHNILTKEFRSNLHNKLLHCISKISKRIMLSHKATGQDYRKQNLTNFTFSSIFSLWMTLCKKFFIISNNI